MRNIKVKVLYVTSKLCLTELLDKNTRVCLNMSLEHFSVILDISIRQAYIYRRVVQHVTCRDWPITAVIQLLFKLVVK